MFKTILHGLFLCSLLFGTACSSPSSMCNSNVCLTGCCDASGLCHAPSNQYCGSSGNACGVCGDGMICNGVVCIVATSGTGGGPQSGTGGGSGGSGGGGGSSVPIVTTCDPLCSTGQVCTNLTCTDVPSSCPCPIETYCSTATNSCVIGCTSDALCSKGRICDSDSRTCEDGCRTDAQCGSGQICQNLACVDGCRSDAQCGAGSICQNLTCITGCDADNQCANGQICQNMMCAGGCDNDGQCTAKQICQNDNCITGCRSDSACSSGQICDNLACRAGCRNDSQCGSGIVCDPMTLACRNGCRMDSECPKEQICSTTALVCQPGCNTDSECNTGRICSSGKCTAGCRAQTDCSLGQYCASIDSTCKPGCGDPTLDENSGLTDRCPLSQACVPVNCNQTTNECQHVCQKNCYGWACNTSTAEPFSCFYPEGGTGSNGQCRESCSSNSNCPTGQICNMFTTDGDVPQDGPTQLCSLKCSTAADCADSVDGTTDGVACVCGADGLCHPNDPSATWACYHTNPAALQP